MEKVGCGFAFLVNRDVNCHFEIIKRFSYRVPRLILCVCAWVLANGLGEFFYSWLDKSAPILLLGLALIALEEHGGREVDGGHEGVRASVMAHGDAAPVLEAPKHVLVAV